MVAKNKPSTHKVVVKAALDTSHAEQDEGSVCDFLFIQFAIKIIKRAAIAIAIKENGANNFSAVKLNIFEASEKGASTTSGQDFITPVITIITSVKAVPNKDAK